MSRRKAIVLAVFTAWPLIYIVFFICTMVALLIFGTLAARHEAGPPALFLVIIPLHVLTMLDLIALLVIYIYHLFTTDRVPKDMKALWGVVLFLGNIIAMPIYWYLYIWRQPPPADNAK